MDEPPYKYDVAFSFLSDDEALARRLDSLLAGRLDTFLYSDRQAEISGTDGEQTLNRVFGTEARVVVVLYRDGWGQTPWTRIEETAIRNRAYEEGYDFVLFIPLDEKPMVPQYLPKHRLWIGLDRWGEDGAASVIEARVQELGGMPRRETVQDRAERMKRQLRAEEERTAFLGSKAGVEAAKEELATLFLEISSIIESATDPDLGLDFTVEREERALAFRSHGYSVSISWSLQWGNSLDQSTLHVVLWKGNIGLRGRMPFEDPKELERHRFDFDRTQDGHLGWRERDHAPARTISTAELAQYCTGLLIDRIDQKRLGNR